MTTLSKQVLQDNIILGDFLNGQDNIVIKEYICNKNKKYHFLIKNYILSELIYNNMPTKTTINNDDPLLFAVDELPQLANDNTNKEETIESYYLFISSQMPQQLIMYLRN